MNLCNWLGIASAGFLYQLFRWIFVGMFRGAQSPLSGAAIVILPVLLMYHPQDESLQETPAESSCVRLRTAPLPVRRCYVKPNVPWQPGVRGVCVIFLAPLPPEALP